MFLKTKKAALQCCIAALLPKGVNANLEIIPTFRLANDSSLFSEGLTLILLYPELLFTYLKPIYFK